MTAVLEIRTYRAKPGVRDRLLEIFRSRAFPVQRRLGMKVAGPFPSREDDVTFVWLRGFPDEESRGPLTDAFYKGPEWVDTLAADVLSMLDDYAAVVVDDTHGLWADWPEDAHAAGHGTGR